MPVEFAIASQLDDYRKKIKQVAEGHPEFLHAVIEYTEKRQEYIEATGWVSKESEWFYLEKKAGLFRENSLTKGTDLFILFY